MLSASSRCRWVNVFWVICSGSLVIVVGLLAVAELQLTSHLGGSCDICQNMALGRPEETALIQSLYTAASQTGGDGWRVFLERLANHTRADFAVLVVREDGQETVSVSAQKALEMTKSLFDTDDTYGLNRLRNGRTYSQEDLPGAILTGGKMLRVARTQTTNGYAWLLVYRERDDFRAIDSSLLSGLMPHIATATDIWAEIGWNSLEFELNRRVSEALCGGWVAFDQNGKVFDADRRLSSQFPVKLVVAVRKVIESNAPLAVTIDADQ